MRVGFVGSREFPNLDAVRAAVEQLDADDIVVSGGARGVDRAAEAKALDLYLDVISFRPVNIGGDVRRDQWAIDRVMTGIDGVPHRTTLPERYPSFAAAAFVRNGYIVELAERLCVFWDGRSRGTKDSLRKAQAAGMKVSLVVDRMRYR